MKPNKIVTLLVGALLVAALCAPDTARAGSAAHRRWEGAAIGIGALLVGSALLAPRAYAAPPVAYAAPAPPVYYEPAPPPVVYTPPPVYYAPPPPPVVYYGPPTVVYRSGYCRSDRCGDHRHRHYDRRYDRRHDRYHDRYDGRYDRRHR